MPKSIENKDENGNLIPASSAENGNDTSKKLIEGDEEESKDIDYKKNLEDLEKGESPAPLPKKSELDKAMFNAKSIIKRVKDLGGNPAELLGEEKPDEAPPAPEVDESKFATKDDIARIEISKLTQNPDEMNLIMWYVKNKGLSIEDAHFMANKGKVKTTLKEITRTRTTIPNRGGGDGGQKPPENNNQRMSEQQEKRLQLSGLTYDPKTNAYTGKRTRVRHNGTTWVHERNENGNWKEIPDASKFD